MIGKELPQDRQQAFVAQQHLPRRFEPVRVVRQQLVGEFFPDQPFPWIELEAGADVPLVLVDEQPPAVVPANALDFDVRGL